MHLNYTKEQVDDITARESKAIELLKELQLIPSAAVTKEAVSNLTFVDKVTPYLQDTKFVRQGDIFVEHEPNKEV